MSIDSNEKYLKELIATHGTNKHANDILNAVRVGCKFKEALDSPIGQALLDEVYAKINNLSLKISDNHLDMTEVDWSDWRCYRGIAETWAKMILQHQHNLESAINIIEKERR